MINLEKIIYTSVTINQGVCSVEFRQQLQYRFCDDHLHLKFLKHTGNITLKNLLHLMGVTGSSLWPDLMAVGHFGQILATHLKEDEIVSKLGETSMCFGKHLLTTQTLK